MGIRVLQNTFNGGEVAPSMYGRIDDRKFAMSCAKVRNFICRPQGPLINRPGTAFVREVKDSSKKVRLLPFIYSSDQTMALEFGPYYIRFHTEGQTLMYEGVPYEIESPYEEDDLFDLHIVQSADVVTICHPRYAPRELRRYSAYDWRLVELKFSMPIDYPTGVSVSHTPGSTEGGGSTSAYTVYYRVTALKDTNEGTVESAASDVASVRCNLYLTNASNTVRWSAVEGADRYRVYQTYSGVYGLLGETEETSFVDANFDVDSGITPPRHDDPFGQENGIASVTVTNGGSGYGLYGSVAAATSGGYVNQRYYSRNEFVDEAFNFTMPQVFVWGWDNAAVRVQGTGSGASVRTTTAMSDSALINTSNAHLYRTLTSVQVLSGGSGYRVGDTYAVYESWGQNGVGIYFRVPLTVTAGKPRVRVVDSTGSGAQLEADVNSSGEITAIRIIRPGSGYTNPTIIIDSNGSGGSGATATATVANTGDFPGAVTYFENRRWFAGTYERPQFVWATTSGSDNLMTYTIPSQDDNRIKFKVAAQDVSRIQHLLPLASLLMLTETTEFRVTSVNSDAITPTSISVKPQTFIGASTVTPLVVNSTAVYVSSRGGHVREIGYSYNAGGYTTADLSVRASHFFETARAVDAARQKSPESVLWFVMNDGSLMGLTYLPDQSVAAWHKHTTEGAFESVCVVPEGDEDAVYFVVRREINGETKRYIERMKPWYFDELRNAFYVDCGATYQGNPTTTITGLSHLEGKTVSILADGGVEPQQVVTNGTVTISAPATCVTIGLPYESEFQSLPVSYQMSDGSQSRGHMKNINKVWVRLYRSGSVFIGPSREKLVESRIRQTEPFGSPPDLVSDEVAVAVTPSWSATGQISVVQKDPLPLELVNITADLAQ